MKDKDNKGGAIMLLLIVLLLALAKKKVKKSSPCSPMGDVDGDGWVTKNDADMIADYVVGKITLTREQLLRADVDGDGTVTIKDGMMIAQFVAGNRTTFPCCSIHGGVQLKAGANFKVVYGGPTTTTVNAFANLGAKLNYARVYRDGKMLSYINPPAGGTPVPKPTFTEIRHNDVIDIWVYEPAFWSW